MEQKILNARDALLSVVNGCGLSRAEIARALNRNDNYVRNAIRRNSAPQADNFAMILAACGYDLVAIPRDGGAWIFIEPRDPKEKRPTE